jgi:hypothetical protein
MTRVARFVCAKHTKTGKNIPNDQKMYLMGGHKIYQLAVNIMNGNKICQHFPLKDPSKYTQIGILV